MALTDHDEVLKIANEDYQNSDTTEDDDYDLLDGTLRLTWGGYHPRSTKQVNLYDQLPFGANTRFSHFGRVVETLELAGEAHPYDIHVATNKIEDLLEKARLYFEDPGQQLAYFLEWQSKGEPRSGTGGGGRIDPAKRALIYQGDLALTMPSGFRGGFLEAEAWATLTLQRHPFWEHLGWESKTFSTHTVWGGVKDLTSEAVYQGTAPARIVKVSITELSGNPTDLWVGIRPEREGHGDYDPLWEAEDGTIVDTTDTSSSADAGASGGNQLECDFANDDTLIERFKITLNQAHSGDDFDHYIGRYLVLARAKVTGGSAIGGVLKYGYPDSVVARNEERVLDEAYWRLWELGEVQIPPHPYRSGMHETTFLREFTLSLWLERLSGSGTVYIDCFYLIPSEHLCTIHKLSDATYNATADILTLPDDRVFPVVKKSSYPNTNAELAPRNWYLPVDPGFLCWAYDEPGSNHSLVVTSAVAVHHIPRWKMYRSQEGS